MLVPPTPASRPVSRGSTVDTTSAGGKGGVNYFAWITTTRSDPVVPAGRRSLPVRRSVTLALHGGGVAPPSAAGHAHATSLPPTFGARRTLTVGLACLEAALECAPVRSCATASVSPLALRRGVSAFVRTAAA